MTPTKLLIGQILSVLAIMIAGVWAATQWAAAMLAYQPQLGLPWLWIEDLPVYRPWSIFPWWFQYGAYAPEVFGKAGALAGASGFLGCAAAVAGSLWRARQVRFVTTYGSARWATGARSGAPACSGMAASSSGSGTAGICAMTGRSTSWPSRRPVAARASAWSCRRC
jgi:type IV secretion system protein VirD4